MALVRQGHTKMAMTGAFAASIFTPLCGFGGSLLAETARTYPQPFRRVEMTFVVGNVLAFEAGVPLLMLLVVAAFAARTKRWELGRSAAVALLLSYGCFVSIVVANFVHGSLS